MNSELLLKNLNPQQQQAVQHHTGPLLIIAGAGSGKTRVITHRIAYLIAHYKVKPMNILAVTFTNKAASEMQDRVKGLIGPVADFVTISTFHSFCARLLRIEGEHIGIKRGFTIYDANDSENLAKKVLSELNLDPKRFPEKMMLGAVSTAKNNLILPEDYPEDSFTEEKIKQFYKLYQSKLRESNAVDFDDLIVQTVLLFKKHPEILKKYQDRYQYIMVDEYQDTNHTQYILVALLAADHKNICVVGDDDQSIYSWRDADIRNILEFEKDFPNTTTIKLEQNYRSTCRILEAANSVISHNLNRKPKTLWTENPKGEKVIVYRAASERHEAQFIADEIKRLTKKGVRLKDIAILYRMNSQSRVIEEVFLNNNLPHVIYGGIRFYDRAEIKDTLAYLRLIANPYDTISFNRAINTPRRGIGPATIAKIEQSKEMLGLSYLDTLLQAKSIPGLGGKLKVLTEFAENWYHLTATQDQLTITELVESIWKTSGYMEMLENEGTDEALSRIDNLKEFLSVTKSYDERAKDQGSLNGFLEEISLISDIDRYSDESNAVSFMTIHSAKGLEFPVVFVTGLEEGLFPSSRSLYDEHQMEEERRLCYVAITRAMHLCYLTHAETRFLWGQTSYNMPSRFLSELPDEADDSDTEKAAVSVKTNSGQPSPDLKSGDKVVHEKFGKGIVIEVKGEGASREAAVVFDSSGLKKLLLEYAKLKKID